MVLTTDFFNSLNRFKDNVSLCCVIIMLYLLTVWRENKGSCDPQKTLHVKVQNTCLEVFIYLAQLLC